MKVTLLNFSDPKNKGDLLIAENSIKLLKKLYNPEICMVNVDFSEDQIIEKKFNVFQEFSVKHFGSFFPKVYSYKKRSFKILESILAFKNLCLSLYIILVTYLFRKNARYLLHSSKRRIFDCIEKSDIVFLKGGSYIYSFGGIKEFLFLYRMLITSIIAIFLKKRIIALSHSMGPFVGKFQFFLAKWTLSKLDKIILREKISYNYLKYILKIDEKKLKVLPDIVYLNTEINKKNIDFFINILKSQNINIRHEDLRNNLKVGLTLRPWHFPLEKPERKKELLENYIECISNLINYLSINYKALCFIFPHVLSDIPFGEMIKERTKNKHLYVVKGDYTIESLKKMYSNMDIFIGTRIHSDIFALSQGIPTIGIAYELHKGFGSFEMLGLEDFVVDIKKLDTKNLIEKVDFLIKHKKEISRKILRRISTFSESIENYLKDILST